MASQAVKFPPVAYRASRLVQGLLPARVSIQKTGRVAGGRQLGSLSVTKLAAIRRIDLVVAHQAIGHLWQPAVVGPVGNLQTAVAGNARIRRVELRA